MVRDRVQTSRCFHAGPLTVGQARLISQVQVPYAGLQCMHLCNTASTIFTSWQAAYLQCTLLQAGPKPAAANPE